MAEPMESMGASAGQFFATAGHKVGNALHELEESAMGNHMHPGLKQRLVIRRLGVVDHELVRLGRDIKFHVHAAVASGGHGLQ